jgi:hypothetical protein
MAPKQAGMFPFDFITVWIRPSEPDGMKCIYCQEPAEYDMHQFVDMRDLLAGGIDAAWMKSIRQQVSGNYKSAYKQPVCVEHCIHFAAIALGKRRPIQQLLTTASMIQQQQGEAISLAIISTVRSFNDEGDNWAVNVPGLRIEDAVRHIKTVKRP